MYKNSRINDQPLVSIVTPVFNAERFIIETILSVINQTYSNWEMLIIDDISIDNTLKIVKSFEKKDSRIRVFSLQEKGGASLARNKGIFESKGKYIAFLDADDIWMPNKLTVQIELMEVYNYVFTYHNYELIDENSKKLGILRKAPKSITYKRMLFGCSIGCLSVVYNCKELGKVQIKRIDKRNDDALWAALLKKCKRGYLLNEDLARYRISHNSLSSGSKIKLLKYHYLLYRKSYEFNLILSLFFTLTNVLIYFWNKLFMTKMVN
ncbi:MAG: glycosyltransferase family 2 protein [Bacilli bacterium]